METIGIIDIGSNSIRLVIAQIYETKVFKTIYEVKKSVRLAQDMTEDGRLNSGRINLAIETLKLFKDICSGFNTSYVISIATAAVRIASNQQYFLERVEAEVGISIKVLSGIEEAYYDYFGIINSMNVSDGIIVDIGGASTELIWVESRKIKESISIPFGAITLTERFNLLEESEELNQVRARDFLMESLYSIPWLKEVRDIPLLGVGGTIRSIGKIDRRKKEYPLEDIHNYSVEAEDVIDIYNVAKDMSIKQRKKIKGLSKDRADIFLGAVSAVECLIKYCNCPRLIVSGSGVREGLIYEYILKSGELLEDVLDSSLNSLVYLHGLNKSDSDETWRISHDLFKELQSLHKKDSPVLSILKTSSFLYNIGADIDYYNYNEHSFYMILNSKINGLTPKEKLMAACIVSTLKKEGIQPEIKRYRTLLLEEDIDTIEKLAIILKISVDINLRKSNNIRNVCLNIIEDTAVIKLICRKNPQMEIEAAMTIAPDFERLFNKKLIIV